MVEIKDAEEYLQIVKNTETSTSELHNVSEKVSNIISTITSKIETLKNTAGSSKEVINGLIEDKKKYASVLDQVKDKLGDFVNGLKELGDIKGLKDVSGQIEKIYNSFQGNFLSGLKDNIGLMAVMGSEMVRNLINPAKDYAVLSSSDKFKGLNESLRSLLDVQNIARAGFLSMGAGIEEADRRGEGFPQLMKQTASSLYISREELKKYGEDIKFIPGALDEVSNSLTKQLGLLQGQRVNMGVAMVAAMGWGLSSSEASSMQALAYTNLNRSGERYINMLGEIHGATKDSSISQTISTRQIMDASASLGIFGSNASLATNIWKTFATSLTQGGVAANSVGDIVKQVTQGIAGMSTQNRAFISMMSGMYQGATALGGALKMEFAMRSPGGLEQNLEALTSSLAKFGGGQIITLEQAANNPQLEMQFVLQRQMLGKLAGITTTEQQNRTLEVLQGVQRGGVSRIQGAGELNSLMKQGMDKQSRTVTAIEKFERTMVDQIQRGVDIFRNLPADIALAQRIGGGGGGDIRTQSSLTRMLSSAATGAINPAEANVNLLSGLTDLGNEFTSFSRKSKIEETYKETGEKVELNKLARYIDSIQIPVGEPTNIKEFLNSLVKGQEKIGQIPKPLTPPITPTMVLTPRENIRERIIEEQNIKPSQRPEYMLNQENFRPPQPNIRMNMQQTQLPIQKLENRNLMQTQNLENIKEGTPQFDQMRNELRRILSDFNNTKTIERPPMVETPKQIQTQNENANINRPTRTIDVSRSESTITVQIKADDPNIIKKITDNVYKMIKEEGADINNLIDGTTPRYPH